MVQFITNILKFREQGEKTGWTYVEIPSVAIRKLKPGFKKSFRVKGKLDGFTIKGVALLPMGGGRFIMPINAAMRKGTGKRFGDKLHLDLEADDSGLKLNAELMICLAEEPSALKFFKQFPKSQQGYFSKWIDGAKTEPTKVKRIGQAVNALIRKQNYPEMIRGLTKKVGPILLILVILAFQAVSAQQAFQNKGSVANYFKSRDKCKAILLKMQRSSSALSTASDTLWVGMSGKDTVITGICNHTGPICVIANKLTIRNANLSNTGNILIVGGQVVIDTSTVNNQGFIYALETGQLTINSSTLTNNGDVYVFGTAQVSVNLSTLIFPQTYFYQLSIILGGAGSMNMNNTILNYNSMSHGFTVTDSAKLTESNMILHGFTTTGISSKGSITINKTTQAGEFIISDYSSLTVKNSDTVLLWHQFPDSAVINWTFGKSDTAYHYQFNKSKAGVKGVEYSVQVDTSYQVWWAMMPSSGSNVTISNSTIRAIGLWFDKANDSLGVSGIHDSTNYSSGQVGALSDRALILNNSYVETWSFYEFKNLKLSISNCQVGEIGLENTSRLYGNNYIVDGTGGYHWTTNQAVAYANSLVDYSWARSEDSSFFVIGYSTLANAEAINTSILIVVQSLVLNGPVASDGGVAWYANINQPAAISSNSNVNINGSAFINRGPSSTLMAFKSWSLYYQKQGDVLWSAIELANTNQVSNGLLSNWNTNGLMAGNYILRLNLKSTYGDSVDAYLGVVISGPTGIGVQTDFSALTLYPNPASGNVTVNFTSAREEETKIVLSDLSGRQEFIQEQYRCVSGVNVIQLNTLELSSGLYVCRITGSKGSVQKIVEIVR